MILDEILRDKRAELSSLISGHGVESLPEELKQKVESPQPVRDFYAAMKGEGVRVIAEVKKASPSKGVIREEFDPVAIARAYEQSGAAAISVLTEGKYFMGSIADLIRVKEAVKVPVLRKDFIFDDYQVMESKAIGADCILLIAAILEEDRLKELLTLTHLMGMSAIVEVHAEDELYRAVGSGARLIGINNRDLQSFKTDIETTKRLARFVPKDRVVISESGINSAEDIRVLTEAGAGAFLVGEALLREQDVGGKLRELAGIA
ncbi:MAG: indole-3-glycerol phosphate synthase TrpC [Thermodesulfobacteriota bacterium]